MSGSKLGSDAIEMAEALLSAHSGSKLACEVTDLAESGSKLPCDVTDLADDDSGSKLAWDVTDLGALGADSGSKLCCDQRE